MQRNAEEDTGSEHRFNNWKELHNKELRNLYSSRDIISIIKWQCLS